MKENTNKYELATRLRNLNNSQRAEVNFVEADLSEVDLSGIKLSFVNLAYANLKNVNLTNARLTNVLLTGAQLQDARLDGAELYFVDAMQADFCRVNASGSRWQQCNLFCTNFDNSILAKAFFRHCIFEKASLKSSDFRNGGLVYTTCEQTKFCRTTFTAVETIGSDFQNAEFEDAQNFFLSREIVVEILKQHCDKRNIEHQKLIGAVSLMGNWCYSEWKKYLNTSDMSYYYSLALEIFSMYPESGAKQALEEGWDWRS